MQSHSRTDDRWRRALLRWLTGIATLSIALSSVGCASRNEGVVAAQGTQGNVTAPVQGAIGRVGTDQERLEVLWHRRTSDGFGSDFTLGPGDLLVISVPLEQLEHYEVRVSPLDTITMPLVGVLDVRGMTEAKLTETLRQRLSEYMYDPPVSLFVKHYGSREVAVMGAVDKPGLYTLASGSDTLMGMIGKAGGMSPDSAAKVIFVPTVGGGMVPEQTVLRDLRQMSGAGISTVSFTNRGNDTNVPGASSQSNTREVAQSGPITSIAPANAEVPLGQVSPIARGSAMANLHPIIIPLNDPTMRDYLELPARPGDTLIIPAAGEVTVGGWVRNPGGFKITPGMTALSAISAAGGALFSDSAQILRTASNGERDTTRIDISNIQKGKEADVPVQSGDVVMVNKSALGAVPYAAYIMLSKFGTGMYIPIP